MLAAVAPAAAARSRPLTATVSQCDTRVVGLLGADWLDRYYKPDGHCNPLGKAAGGPVSTSADLLSLQWGGHSLLR
jgi:hypothetical protein